MTFRSKELDTAGLRWERNLRGCERITLLPADGIPPRELLNLSALRVGQYFALVASILHCCKYFALVDSILHCCKYCALKPVFCTDTSILHLQTVFCTGVSILQ